MHFYVLFLLRWGALLLCGRACWTMMSRGWCSVPDTRVGWSQGSSSFLRMEIPPRARSVRRHELTTIVPLTLWPDCYQLNENIFARLCDHPPKTQEDWDWHWHSVKYYKSAFQLVNWTVTWPFCNGTRGGWRGRSNPCLSTSQCWPFPLLKCAPCLHPSIQAQCPASPWGRQR